MKKEKVFTLEAELEVPLKKIEVQTLSIKADTLENAKGAFLSQVNGAEGVQCVGINKKASPIPGIISFSIALLLTTIPFYEKNGFSFVFLFPNVISLLCSLFIYSSFVIRVKGISNTFKNIPDFIISILCILVLGSFIKIFLADSVVSVGWVGWALEKMGLNNSHLLIAIAIIFSWIGIKSIAGFMWIIIAILGMVELATAGEYMGEYISAVFILSSFCGFIFYLKYEGKIVINSFSKMASNVGKMVVSDLNSTKEIVEYGAEK
ncbi:MAG: hypothetical protein ACTTKH_07510 [Treponema sp.]